MFIIVSTSKFCIFLTFPTNSISTLMLRHVYSLPGDYTGNENNNAGGMPDLSATFDPWMECISIFMHPSYVIGHCVSAVGHAWPMLFNRLKDLDIDPVYVCHYRGNRCHGYQ